MLFVRLRFHLVLRERDWGIPPGVFAKSVEVVLNVGVVKTVKIESVEVTDGMGLAGERDAGRVRRGDFHISW